MKIINNEFTKQGLIDLFTLNNVKCFEVNNLPVHGYQKNLINSVQNLQKTLGSLERSIRKTNKYEAKLMRCKNIHHHGHSHDQNKWWGNDPSKQNGYKCSNTGSNTSSRTRSRVDQTESWSTMSFLCLQYQYEELSKCYEALLQSYDDQCSAMSLRDTKLAQWRQQANVVHEQLVHAHKALLTIGERYLALKHRRHSLKSRYEEQINKLKNTLHDVVEMTVREQMRFDAMLCYCMSTERSSDAALLLSEIRKCNHLFVENMQLKSIIQELLPGHWKKC